MWKELLNKIGGGLWGGLKAVGGAVKDIGEELGDLVDPNKDIPPVLTAVPVTTPPLVPGGTTESLLESVAGAVRNRDILNQDRLGVSDLLMRPGVLPPGTRTMDYRYGRDDVSPSFTPLASTGQTRQLPPINQVLGPETSAQTDQSEDVYDTAMKYFTPPAQAQTDLVPSVTTPDEQQQQQQPVNPTAERLRRAMEEYYQLQQMKPKDFDKNPDGPLKNMGKSIALILPQLQQMLFNPNISDKQALSMSLGAIAGGGITGLVSPYADERAQRDYELARKSKEIEDLQGLYGADIKNRVGEAQIRGVDSQIEKREKDVEIAQAKVERQQTDADTRRIKELMNIYTKQDTVDENTAAELADTISRITKTPIKLPKKHANVERSFVITDAADDRVKIVSVLKDGNRIEDWIRNEDGTIARIQDPRVRQALINNASQERRQTQRLEVDREKIALAKEKLKQDAKFKELAASVASKKLSMDQAAYLVTFLEDEGVDDDRRAQRKAAVEKALASGDDNMLMQLLRPLMNPEE